MFVVYRLWCVVRCLLCVVSRVLSVVVCCLLLVVVFVVYRLSCAGVCRCGLLLLSVVW